MTSEHFVFLLSTFVSLLRDYIIVDSKPSPTQTVNSSSPPQLRGVDLLRGDVTPSLWKFATPLIFSFLAQIVYVWIDTFFIRHLGPAAIAAAGVCEQVMFFTYTLGGGFATGTSILVARRIGEQRREEAENIASQSLNAMFLAGVILGIILYAAMPFLLHLLGLKGEVEMYALAYMSMVLFAFPANLLIFQINSIARSAGNSMFSMRVLVISALLNIAFAPVFIYGIGPIPALGMYGAGLATALAIITSCSIAVWNIFNDRSGLRIRLNLALPHWKIVRQILTLGVPTSLQMLCISSTRVSIYGIVSSFGLATTTAYTLGTRMDFLIFMPVLAFGIAMETITAQNLGAQQPERVIQFYRTAVWQVSALAASIGSLIFLGSNTFAQIFVKDAAVLSAVHSYLSVSIFGYPLLVLGVLSIRVLSGAGKPFVSLGIVFFSFLCTQFPAAYILSHYTSLQSSGIWFGVLTSYCCFAGSSAIFVAQKRWIQAVI